MKWYDAKGDPASRLRQRKHALLRGLYVPPDALPGSLALTHHHCGKPTCRCADGEGHPAWSLTFMVDGKKRVEHKCQRSEEHTSELHSRLHLVCRLLLEKKNHSTTTQQH